MSDFDVLVVGTGIVGHASAFTLSRLGLRVGVVGQSGAKANVQHTANGRSPFGNRVFAIRPSIKKFLTESLVWDGLSKERIQSITRMNVEGNAGERLTLDAHEAGVLELAWIVESENLKKSITKQLTNEPMVTQFNADITDVQRGGDEVRLATSQGLFTCKLLIGADGSKSMVRRCCDIKTQSRDYKYTGLVANFSIAHAHRGAAYQQMGSSGVIGYLPLPGNLVSVVWSTSDDLSGKINEETILSELKNRYDPLNIVSMESSLGRFPLKRGTPSSAAMDRVILVGDAAHQFLPLAGQGLNVGLADVETLASVVKECGDGDPGCLSVTNRYRRARREEIESFTRFTELMHDTSSSDKAVYRALQRFGFGAVNQIGILKRFFIDKALG